MPASVFSTQPIHSYHFSYPYIHHLWHASTGLRETLRAVLVFLYRRHCIFLRINPLEMPLAWQNKRP